MTKTEDRTILAGDLYRHTESGTLVEVIETCSGSVYYYPRGGGRMRISGEGVFLSEHHPVREGEIEQGKIRGLATLDDLGPFPCQYDPDHRWNGWHVPVFTREVEREIAAALVEQDGYYTGWGEDENGVFVVDPGPDRFRDYIDEGSWCWECSPAPNAKNGGRS